MSIKHILLNILLHFEINILYTFVFNNNLKPRNSLNLWLQYIFKPSFLQSLISQYENIKNLFYVFLYFVFIFSSELFFNFVNT